MSLHPEQQYLDLCRDILENGADKELFFNDVVLAEYAEKGEKPPFIRSVFGRQMRFDLSDGFPLLTDDILAVEFQGKDFVAHPGYPYMRLWQPEAQYFLGHYEDLELVDPRASKRWVPIGAKGLGSFCEFTQRLKCLYILERYEPENANEDIQITPISPRDAVIELVRYSFAYPIVENVGLQPRRIDFFARLAQQIPIHRIRYPSGLEHLPQVKNAILEDSR